MPKSVLIVDDSSLIRKALRRLFASDKNFAALAEAANGREAIEKAKEVNPDLIVIDLSMPLMDGLAATRVLHRIMPRVPIIMYSAFSDALPEEEARGAGVSAVISKSDVSSLMKKARSLCDQKAA